MQGVPVRDLKLVLGTVKQALSDPTLCDRLLALCERNEKTLESIRTEQHELMCLKSEHRQFLARAGKEHDERLRNERLEWEREEAQRRARLEMDEAEAARRREAAGKDREAAAALRCKLEQKFAPVHTALGEFQQQWEQDPAERAREKAAARAAEN
jgi:hypothetical protein